MINKVLGHASHFIFHITLGQYFNIITHDKQSLDIPLLFARYTFIEIANLLVVLFPCFSIISNIILNGLLLPACSGPEMCSNKSLAFSEVLELAMITLSLTFIMFSVTKYFNRLSMSVIVLSLEYSALNTLLSASAISLEVFEMTCTVVSKQIQYCTDIALYSSYTLKICP